VRSQRGRHAVRSGHAAVAAATENWKPENGRPSVGHCIQFCEVPRRRACPTLSRTRLPP
jgi:hypothetical protein